ncbi:hypothetical protein JDV02_009668 [Purpureocillium takamizusanense]|nr:uncharacterized protein JDV02_009668 [Purpureocillium takamizusanense]UNI23876.1 hypothetical protein JDV02_009668 [Purpureocillium takamizusanense]
MLYRHGNDPAETQRDNSSDMSLSEKMALWSRNEGSVTQGPECADASVMADEDLPDSEAGEDRLSDGSEQIGVDGANAAELSAYMNLILDSHAYKWLLSSLRNETLLTATTGGGQSGDESIKAKILDKLPRCEISRHKAPMVYNVVFELTWNLSSFLHLLRDRSGSSLADDCCIIGSSGSFQAMHSLPYFKQTWANGAERLHRLLSRTLASQVQHENIFLELLPDNSSVASWMGGSRLYLNARGPAYSVAEYGEQFSCLSAAWLCRALQQETHHWNGYCKPTIVATDLKGDTHLNNDKTPPTQRALFKIGFQFGREDHDVTRTGVGTWRGLFRNPVIIKGFPIPRRPESCPGLEVSFNMMKELVGAGRLQKARGRVCIKGSRGVLALSRLLQDIIVWTVALDLSEDPLFTANNAVLSAEQLDILDLASLETAPCRHIILDHLDYEVPKNVTEHPLFGRNPSKYTAENYCDEDFATAVPKHGKVNLPLYCGTYEGGLNMETESTRSKLTQSSITKRLFVLPDDRHASEATVGGDKAVSPGESPNVTTVSLDSLDSDMLSVSDSSERLDPFGLGPAACEILTGVLHSLLEEWQAWVKNCPQTSRGTRTTVSSQPTESSSSMTSPSQSRKRDRSSDEQDEDYPQRGSPGLATKRAKSDDTTRKLFACPFWKKGPSAHQVCFSMKLARIRDVKQHLARKHTPNHYCERCFQVFEQKPSHTAHVMSAESCHPRPLETLDGVTNEQRKELSKKSKRSQTPAEQWYAVWDILFGDAPRPESPYMDFEQSQDFDSFRRFCSPRVGAVLAEQLTDQVLTAMLETPVSERLPTILQLIESGFRVAWESFVASSAASTEQDATHATGGRSIANASPWVPRAPTRPLLSTSSSEELQLPTAPGLPERPMPGVSALASAPTSGPRHVAQQSTETRQETTVEAANEAADDAQYVSYFDWDGLGAYAFPYAFADDSLEPNMSVSRFFDAEPFDLVPNLDPGVA